MILGRDKEENREIVAGAIVIVVAVGIGAWVQFGSARDSVSGYDLQVRIPKADGLSTGSEVRISGINIGSIASLSLDPNTYLATVHLNIQNGVRIPVDSAMVVTSNGMLGNPNITILPGVSKVVLQPGGTIAKSCGSEDIMSMIGRVGLSSGQGSCPRH